MTQVRSRALRAGLGVALGLTAACGEEPPLSLADKQTLADDAGRAIESGGEVLVDTTVAPDSTADTGTANAAGTSAPESYLVPESEARHEVTQVYNGDTHLVADAPATLRAESDDVAVYVQDGLFSSQVTGDHLDGLVARLVEKGSEKGYLPELGILPTNEAVFGPLQRDNLPGDKQRVFVVDTAGAGDGYLCGWCTYPDLHLDGHLVSPLDGEHALSISAHELYHAIHRGYDADEEVWMDESLAEAAMTVNGFFTDQAWLSDFLDNANRDWGPSGADVTSVHYGACLAWGTYLWEQGGPELMRALTQESQNGWSGLDAALTSVGETRTGWELFLELGAALYFDDPGRGFGIRSFDLPRALQVATLNGEMSARLEPYGFLHYVVNEETRLTVEGEAVTAVYVEDQATLGLRELDVGVSFDAPGPGVLILTSRAGTSVTVRAE